MEVWNALLCVNSTSFGFFNFLCGDLTVVGRGFLFCGDGAVEVRYRKLHTVEHTMYSAVQCTMIWLLQLNEAEEYDMHKKIRFLLLSSISLLIFIKSTSASSNNCSQIIEHFVIVPKFKIQFVDKQERFMFHLLPQVGIKLSFPFKTFFSVFYVIIIWYSFHI